MALISLAIAFIFGLAFLKRCWIWDFGDEELAFANYFDANWNLGWFSEILTVVALNISLLYSFGLLKGGSISCAVLLLVAAAMTSIGMIESYIPSDYSRVTCRPLPLTYLITAAQLVIAIHIFIEEHRIKRS